MPNPGDKFMIVDCARAGVDHGFKGAIVTFNRRVDGVSFPKEVWGITIKHPQCNHNDWWVYAEGLGPVSAFQQSLAEYVDRELNCG